MSEHTFQTAFALISSLRVGDRVRVQRAGERAYEMTVSRGPSRSDGNWGSPESLHVTVTFGPGRYATEVGVDDLWRRRKGHGWIGGGTTIEKIEEPDEEVLKDLDVMFSHLADDHGEDEPE
jgi:hypothetical protein